MQPQTPGVYIKELNAFPNSVVEVATAVPVFIGYTAKADYNGQSLANKPQRLTSLSEYETYFGQGAVPLFDLQEQSKLTQDEVAAQAALTVHPINLSINDITGAAPATPKQYALVPADNSTIFYLHNSIRLFYQHGGAACYIVSIGQYGSDNAPNPSQETVQPANAGGVVGSSATSSAPPTPITPQKDNFVKAIDSLIYEQEPTMLLCPDALNLTSDDYYAVVQKMLQHCNDTQSRVAVLDVYNGAVTNPLDLDGDPTAISLFRDGVGNNNLKYGVSYFPWVVTTVVGANETTFQNLSKDVFNSLATGAQAAVDAATSAVAAKKGKPDLSTAQQNQRNAIAYNNLVKNAQLIHTPTVAANAQAAAAAATATAGAQEAIGKMVDAATALTTEATATTAATLNADTLVNKATALQTAAKATSAAADPSWAPAASNASGKADAAVQAAQAAQTALQATPPDTSKNTAAATAATDAVAAANNVNTAFTSAQSPVFQAQDAVNKMVAAAGELSTEAAAATLNADTLVNKATALQTAAKATSAAADPSWAPAASNASGKADAAVQAAQAAQTALQATPPDTSKNTAAATAATDAVAAANNVNTAFTSAQKPLAVQAQIAADDASAKASLITDPPTGQTAAQASQTAQVLATASQTDAVANGVAWVNKTRAYATLAQTAVDSARAAAAAPTDATTVKQAQNDAANAAAAADDAATAANYVMTAAEIQTEVLRLHNALLSSNPDYKRIVDNVTLYRNTLPVAPAMAGVYTTVDNSRGVWKAPANVSLDVVKPTLNLSDNDQARLNVDAVSGKSVNAIRPFPSLGVLVWGARTLDGNSQDWRYVNVRRTMIMLEQSIKLAARAYVFEPNDANTWVTVQSMLSNFLHNQWQAGALVGTKPEDAYSVAVGLGSTMTGEDVLDGFMNVFVKVAISRPAEFVVLTFQQQMQTS